MVGEHSSICTYPAEKLLSSRQGVGLLDTAMPVRVGGLSVLSHASTSNTTQYPLFDPPLHFDIENGPGVAGKAGKAVS